MGEKLLILGNGFDLAHNLPTKYEHFLGFSELALKIYSFNVSDKTSVAIDAYKSAVEKYSGHDYLKNELVRLFGMRKVKVYKKGDDDEYSVSVSDCRLNKYYDYLKHNIWYKYIQALYTKKRIKGENWIDFETEISCIIRYIDGQHEDLNVPFSQIYQGMKKSNELEGKYSMFIAELDKNWECKDIPSGTSNRFKCVAKVPIYSIRNRLYDDLEKLILAFEIYLTEFVDKIPVKQKIRAISKIKPDYVITFNYTKTYEKLYGADIPVCHIHGCCEKNRDEDDNNMVMGIDKYTLSGANECDFHFSIFKKYIQRIRKRNDVTYSLWADEMRKNYEKYVDLTHKTFDVDFALVHASIPLASKIDKAAFSDIYTFGHSLDVTDKDILERFLLPEYTRIHIYATGKANEGELITNLLGIVGEQVVIEKSTFSPPRIEFLPCIEK